MEKPVRIAGAGPAGLSCAIALARAGRAVVVSEARPTVGARFIGDLQVLENFSEEEDVTEMLSRLAIQPDFLGRGLLEAELFDARLRRTAVRSERPFAYFLRRGHEGGTLDASLLAQARSAGAEVRFNERLEPREADVAATGPRVADGLAREMTFETDSPDRVQVLFDAGLAPGGYGYLFVVSGFATLGCAVIADMRNVDRYFELCAERFREVGDYSVRGKRSGYSYMSFAIPRSEQLGAARLAGEAGGFQDYLFGLGIRYALASGHLAARSILAGRPFDELWRRELGAKRRASLGVRLLYEALGDPGLSFFARRGGRGDFRRFLRRWSRPTLAKELLSLAARLRWRRPHKCAHRLPDHWCRARPARSDLPEQGPRAQETAPARCDPSPLTQSR